MKVKEIKKMIRKRMAEKGITMEEISQGLHMTRAGVSYWFEADHNIPLKHLDYVIKLLGLELTCSVKERK